MYAGFKIAILASEESAQTLLVSLVISLSTVIVVYGKVVSEDHHQLDFLIPGWCFSEATDTTEDLPMVMMTVEEHEHVLLIT